jgi:Mg-chelatase subunit ChlD
MRNFLQSICAMKRFLFLLTFGSLWHGYSPYEVPEVPLTYVEYVEATNFRPLKPTPCLRADIVFVCDFSSSISGSETFHSNVLASFLKSEQLVIGEGDVRIGVVTFADGAYYETHLTGNRKQLQTIADLLFFRPVNGGTDLSSGIIYGFTEFDSKDDKREAIRIMVLMTDAKLVEQDEIDSDSLATIAKKSGIQIVTMGVSDRIAEDYEKVLQRLASSTCTDTIGNATPCYFGNNYDNFRKLLEKKSRCM